MSHLPRFSGKAFFAPMAGVSDPAMRLLCRRMGAALVVTELTSIHGIVARGSDPGAIPELASSEGERPVSVQLFGSEVEVLERAARIVEPFFDVIDYNMGCPAPHITQQMAGGALLQKPDLTRRIFRTLVRAVDKPVTLKLRSGVTSCDLFGEIARTAQEEGISMITLHPRTVSQGYSGRADWSLIRKLKGLVDIPVVGNGDITNPEDARDMLEQTGCDYVMVGRGAMGNPFIFEQINDLLERGSYTTHTDEERIAAFFDYLQDARRFGIRLSSLKSQAMRFIRGMAGSSVARSQITTVRDEDDLCQIMRAMGAGRIACAAQA